MDPYSAVRRLNEKFSKIDDNLFELENVAENFFGEYIVTLKARRMVKATYLVLKKIAEITGAKDILIMEISGDNLVKIKLTIPK